MKSSHRFPLRRRSCGECAFYLSYLAGRGRGAVHPLQPICARQLPAGGRVQPAAGGYLHRDQSGQRRCSLNWASIDSTVRRYITQENINGTQTIAAYEAMQEKYYSSTLYSHILRFFITNENDRHLQFGTLNSSAGAQPHQHKSVSHQGVRDAVHHRPLLPGSPGCIALSQPVRCGKGTLHRGSTYLALDTAIITDPAAGYSLTDGSACTGRVGSRLWQIETAA